jgi:Cys-tRNA(Pro)/Cys-tRNA(Cys) deacylase
MVLVAGPQQISWQSLRTYFGQSRLTMASEEDVVEVTGYQLGSVSPFGLPVPIRILVDESVFKPEEISIGSGVRYTTVLMKTTDLVKALAGAEVGKFCKSE